MTTERKYEFELSTPTEEAPPPPPYARTWGNDSLKDKGKRRRWRLGWKWKPEWNWSLHEGLKSAHRTTKHGLKHALHTISGFSGDNVKPFLKRLPITKKQSVALFLLIIFGIAPFAVVGVFTVRPFYSGREGKSFYVPFYNVFSNKVQSCGNSFDDRPQNATTSGIQKLFVLDNTFGHFSFSQAKMIDVSWDLLVGPGIQALDSWAGYVVFSDALLRLIERQPASFCIFQRIALEGPGLVSLWSLTKEMWAAKSRRTKALFFYMLLSTCYLLSVPLFLSAMTGYDSTSIAWVSLGNDTNNIVPAAGLEQGWVIFGTRNQTFEPPSCQSFSVWDDVEDMLAQQARFCDCQLADGTMVHLNPEEPDMDRNDCKTDYPNNTQTYTSYEDGSEKTHNCNATVDVMINGISYDASSQNLNSTYGYCYNSVGYGYKTLENKVRCLPDTANPTYQWGFSTMMSGIFVFLQFVWCLTMYAVWQDAQFNSPLVKSGYKMSPLRAVFAMTKAAVSKTGLSEKQLVRANKKEVEQELYGCETTKATAVEHSLFADDPEEDGYDGEVIRRRSARPKYAPNSSEVTLRG